VGDRVWLDAKNLTTTHPTTKLAPKHYGPFLVTAAISHTSYHLKLPPQWKIHNVFHASLLTPYKETPEHGPNFPEPSLELINGELEWEVEQIMNTRRRCNQLQYLVRWKGFSEAHDSWEPTTHVHADHLIEAYYQQNPSAVRHLEYITPPPPSLPIIIRTIMTSPTQNPIPLADHLSPSTSIPLIECLSSPPPSPLTEIATDTGDNFELAMSSLPLPVVPLSGRISEPTSFSLSIETQTPPYGLAASTPSPDEAPELRELTPPTGTPIMSHYSFDMANSQAASPNLVYLLGNQFPPPDPTDDPHFNTPSPVSIPKIKVLHPKLPIPLGYQRYNPYNATHVQYKVDIPMPGGGVKKPHYIQFNINEYNHHHTIKAKRVNADDPFGDYGTDLVAAPFWDPLPNITDDNDLNPFTPSYPNTQAIDIAAAGLVDPGVIADIDRYHVLWSEKEELQRHEHDLRVAWDQWRDKNHSVQHCLQAARTCSHLHPYLQGQAHAPSICNNINTAISSGIPIADVLHGQVADPPYCLPMPWLHDEERPGVSHWVMSMGRQSHVSEKPELQCPTPPAHIKCTKCQYWMLTT